MESQQTMGLVGRQSSPKEHGRRKEMMYSSAIQKEKRIGSGSKWFKMSSHYWIYLQSGYSPAAIGLFLYLVNDGFYPNMESQARFHRLGHGG